MKKLISNIWNAPASTSAGAICAALAVVTAADVGLPPPWQVGLLALAAFLGFFGDRKPV
ncbi:MAG: hypothetical protein KDN05_24195 [Verrucomicrobiae bacterium]|nr:hypothetical protein [Verrucomicrobiae bacterium]